VRHHCPHEFAEQRDATAWDGLCPICLNEYREQAEDFRAEIAREAFTAPDADWNTILDSLRARIADALQRGEAKARCGWQGICDKAVGHTSAHAFRPRLPRNEAFPPAEETA
jgi:hypothetical protein